jgi:hypothetical protein
MSERKDEIDWEIVGADHNGGLTNVFYKGIPEFGLHSETVKFPSGSIDEMHTYVIDWYIVI